MASDISTIQSLKAVDAWIDVINANINGGVRTAFKSTRLKFGGSNTEVSRAGTSTSLPLQFPEPGLTMANTVIDFSQGAITASTETTHLAIQGEGFFLLASPDMIETDPTSLFFGGTKLTPTPKLLLTRDGEFHTDANGLLVHSSGFYLVSNGETTGPPSNKWVFAYSTALSDVNTAAAHGIEAIFNDIDASPPPASNFVHRLSDYLTGTPWPGQPTVHSIVQIAGGKQNLQYSSYGSTVFDFGFRALPTIPDDQFDTNVTIVPRTDFAAYAASSILNKSLEASNASMTQSVPELSLAQKLFSALTKVLQTKQTNVDGVLNLVR